jgi:hypothetical protein
MTTKSSTCEPDPGNAGGGNAKSTFLQSISHPEGWFFVL